MLDLTRGPVGGVATMVLADFGAEVWKIEPPGGDPFRAQPAAPFWLRGKRSVVLDLRQESARARLSRLAEAADVAVVSGAPDSYARLGADRESLSARNPALVYCAISGWGARGPYASYPGWEGVVAARSGRMTGFAGQRARPGPGFAAVNVGSHAAAQGAVQGIVAALLAREQDGRGRRVETSLLQAMMPYDLLLLTMAQLPELAAGAGDRPVVLGGMPTLNYHPVMARDGRWIQLGNLLEHHFYGFLDAIGLLPELLADDRFQGPPERWDPDAVEEARDRILVRMQERTAAEWMDVFRAHGNVAAEMYASSQEALHHPDLVANGDIVTHEHPALGPVRQIGPLARLVATPGRAGAPAPEPDRDAKLLSESDARRPAVPASPGTGPPPGRPLEGVTVLELATIIAAPLGVALLADQGARVIKVEPLGGDPFRALGPAGVLAAKTNAGKESICIDLKREQGSEILRDLVRRADVIVHNYRPGVPERLGIGYEQARALRPDVVWVAATGYGPDSPGAARPSAHPVPGAATGGVLWQAGAAMPPEKCESLAEVREASRQLMRANEANPDPNTSVVIASATLLALLARRRFGIGQQVFVNMLATNAYANGDDFLDYAGKPPRPELDAEVTGLAATYRLYPAEQGWVFFAAPRQRDWTAFCELAGCPDLLADARFATAESRGEHDAALAEALAQRFATRPAEDWEQLLAPAGVGCVRADATAGEFFALDPHVLENGFTPLARHARLGELRRWGPLVTVDGLAPAYGPGPLAGEHTDALLGELGRTAEEIASLRAARVVASEPL